MIGCPNSVIVIVIVIHTVARSQDLEIMVVISVIKLSEMVKKKKE